MSTLCRPQFLYSVVILALIFAVSGLAGDIQTLSKQRAQLCLLVSNLFAGEVTWASGI